MLPLASGGAATSYRAEVLADAPVGYWRLGEASGTTAADETANGTSGTYLGGVTLGVAGAVSGDSNTAARFDGVDDRVSMGDPASGVLDFGSSDFSVEAWIKTSVNAERTVAGKKGSSRYWYVTVTDDASHVGRLRASLRDGAVMRQAYSLARVDDGAWHHVVVLFDRDTGITFFVDGVSSGFTAGAMTGDVGNTANLQIGKVSGYGYFQGDLDEFALYRALLPAARVRAHYDAAVADTTAPAVTLTAPANGSSTTDTTPTFSGAAGTAPGDSTAITVRVYSGSTVGGTPVQTLTATASGGTYSTVASSPLAVGTYTAQAEQSDAAGNTGLSSANVFRITDVDEDPPAVTLVTPAHNSSTTDATPTFSGAAGTAPGDSATVTVKIYSGSSVGGTPVQTRSTTASGGSYSVDASPALAPATYTARAEQADGAGNVGFSSANTFTISSADPILAGAGDIADCGTSARDEETAQLLDGLPTAGVFTLGDNAYNSGTVSEFANCYDPTWGRHKARTHPSPGNHDYGTPGAAGYFNYFGAAAGDPSKGWYSYEAGAWHVVALNTNCYPVGGCDPGDPQVEWLRADLAAHPAACTLAYFHHPLFTSRRDSQDPASETFWQLLYQAGADLILTGHAHLYERFAPQTPSGALDLAYGIRQITAGTGGYSLYTFDPTPAANSQVRFNDSHGVLKLTLHPGSYEWQFLPIAGATSTDSGSTACHGAPGGSPPPPPRPPPTPPPSPPAPSPPPPSPPSPPTPVPGPPAPSPPPPPPSPSPPADPPSPLPPPPSLEPPIDTTPPNTRITSGPAGRTTARRVTFRFVASEAGSTFRCRLDRGSWRPCASPTTYRQLRLGRHTFRVTARDEAGNVDATPALRRWRISRPAP